MAVLRNAILGVVALLLLAIWQLSPWAVNLEEQPGLDLLFQWRGERPVPDDLVIVAITEQTPDKLHLSRLMTDWPRSVYAGLVSRLTELGARFVAFDVFFEGLRESGPDQQFADAMAKHGGVMLFAHSRRQVLELNGQSLYQDSIIYPHPLFAKQAFAIHPFPLPKVGASVRYFWLRRVLDRRYHTFPVALWHYTDPKKNHFEDVEPLGATLPYNFYGPPRSITTIDLEDLFADPARYAQQLRNAVVFVGYSAHHQPGQRDGFRTPFTSAGQLDISGVELSATAFSNLREQSWLRQSHTAWAIATAIFALIVFLIFRLLRPLWAFPLLLGWLGAYLSGVFLLFAKWQIWLPWITPVLIVTPLLVLTLLGWRVRQIGEQKLRLERSFGHYLPPAEIKRLAASREFSPYQESIYGLCVVTDAQGYTRVAESLSSDALKRLMDDYYRAIIDTIRRFGGVISDVAGDGIIALWPDANPQDVGRLSADVIAALDQSVIEFNELHHENTLPTRIGAHAGEVLLGHFGAGDYFEYRAVGDIVNTASRLEGANKTLGVMTLVSRECTSGHDSAFRKLGWFLLKGKQQPVYLCSPRLNHWLDADEERFQEALEDFQRGMFVAAEQKFRNIYASSSDPVSDFLRSCCLDEALRVWLDEPQGYAVVIVRK